MDLVHLSRTICRKKAMEFVKSARNRFPMQLKLNGESSWDPTLIRFKSAAGVIPEETIWKREDSRLVTGMNLASCQCLGCTLVEYSSCKAFQTVDLDTKQKCNACEVQKCVKKWECTAVCSGIHARYIDP